MHVAYLNITIVDMFFVDGVRYGTSVLIQDTSNEIIATDVVVVVGVQSCKVTILKQARHARHVTGYLFCTRFTAIHHFKALTTNHGATT